MSNQARRLESLLFNYETVTATDFRDGEIKSRNSRIQTQYQENKPSRREVKHPPLKDLTTLTDWKSPHVPFNLFGKPKDIVQTDPRILQEPFDKPVDEEREMIRKTLPRLIATSIGSLDDFPDESRQYVLDDVYTSTTHKSLKTTMEIVTRTIRNNNVVSPMPKKPAPLHPITLPNVSIPYVSPEWRMDSASWDRKGLRASCDCTQEFWLNRPSQ